MLTWVFRPLTALGFLAALIATGLRFFETEAKCLLRLNSCSGLQRDLVAVNECRKTALLWLRYRPDESGQWRQGAWRVSPGVSDHLRDQSGVPVVVSGGHYYFAAELTRAADGASSKSHAYLGEVAPRATEAREFIYKDPRDLLRRETTITIRC